MTGLVSSRHDGDCFFGPCNVLEHDYPGTNKDSPGHVTAWELSQIALRNRQKRTYSGERNAATAISPPSLRQIDAIFLWHVSHTRWQMTTSWSGLTNHTLSTSAITPTEQRVACALTKACRNRDQLAARVQRPETHSWGLLLIVDGR